MLYNLMKELNTRLLAGDTDACNAMKELIQTMPTEQRLKELSYSLFGNKAEDIEWDNKNKTSSNIKPGIMVTER